MTELEEKGLSIEKAISDKLDITKESLIDSLRTIHQNGMADILAEKQGKTVHSSSKTFAEW